MTSLDKLLYDASQGLFPEISTDGVNLDEQIDGVTLVKDIDGKIKVSDNFVGSGVELPINISDVTDLQDKLDDTEKYTDDKITNLLNNLEQNFTKNDHKHQISDIIETSAKQFIDGTLKAQITANTGDISGFGQRISDVENIVNGLTTTDEKVKIDANDTSGYLADKLDGTTLTNLGGKVVAKSLDGMTVTVNDLNQLSGLTSNVQSQIDSLSNITSISQVVNTELDLPTDVGTSGTTILVREDSTQNGATTFYTSDGTTWQYVSQVDSGIARDFTVDPINLTIESTGILPKTRYEKQNSAETPFTDSSGNIQANNAEEAIKEVFQYSDSIRKQWSSAIGLPLNVNDKLQDQLIKYQSLITNIANAITSKGVPVYSYNKLNELPNKITSIPNTSISSGLKKIPLLNIIAPHTESITLNEPLQVGDIATSLIELVDGEKGVVHYQNDFIDANRDDFLENKNVAFDGVMKLQENHDKNLITDGTIDGVELKYTEFNASEYQVLNGVLVK